MPLRFALVVVMLNATTDTSIGNAHNGLLDAIVHLVRLLDSRLEARLLVPLIKREIVYRLLLGEQGGG